VEILILYILNIYIKFNLTLFFSIVFSAVGASAQPPEEKLAAYCYFDGSTSDVTNNFSVQSSHSIQYGTSRKKINNSCLLLGNKSDLIYKDKGDSLNILKSSGLFFSLWVKTNKEKSDSNQYLFSKNYPNALKSGYALRINKLGFLEFIYRYGEKKKEESIINSQILLNDGKWHMVQVGINNGKSISFYLDDQVAKSDPLKEIRMEDDSLFHIGTDYKNNGHLTGLIDDFRAYKYMLSDLERQHLFREGVLTNYILIPLNNKASANNTCTFMVGLDPTGEEVVFNTGKYEKMKGYSIRVINNKSEVMTTFKVDKPSYRFDINQWGGHARYFMEVLNEQNQIDNIFKLDLYF
jgi:hypothetical protein